MKFKNNINKWLKNVSIGMTNSIRKWNKKLNINLCITNTFLPLVFNDYLNTIIDYIILIR